MKKPLILTFAAVFLLAAFAAVRFWPDNTADPNSGIIADDHEHDHGGYLTYIDINEVETLTLTPKGGEPFTITASGDTFTLDDNCNPEELYTTVLYASTLPYYKVLGTPEMPLGDYGLEVPSLFVTINTEVSFSIGSMTLDKSAYYALFEGEIFLVDAELAAQLLLPREAYILRKLWPGEPGDRPALTEITLSLPLTSSRYGGYTIIRNELDDDSPLGLSRYELTAPIVFSCNDDAVREKVLSRILSIDLDEFAVNAELFSAACHKLHIKADDFEKTLYIGGTAPDGGRYLMLEENGTVYIDRLGDYGFLDVTPLDLTYGLAFWLYKIDDVESITVMDSGRERTLPNDISEINKRRFFVHILNFSVADMAQITESGFENRIILKMTDGSTHELSFAQQNERQLAVSVDGQPPVFACNIKDWQQIIADLDALDAGKGIRED